MSSILPRHNGPFAQYPPETACFGQFTGEDQPDGGLNLPGSDGGLLVVPSKPGGFLSKLLEDVVDEAHLENVDLVGLNRLLLSSSSCLRRLGGLPAFDFSAPAEEPSQPLVSMSALSAILQRERRFEVSIGGILEFGVCEVKGMKGIFMRSLGLTVHWLLLDDADRQFQPLDDIVNQRCTTKDL
ncbi:hypothetical protein HAX54_039271 [Datura stramonium]|uniref:Uncharacterized protein n=1 Tax=Datura stramonium TaxID=4076 RepID=A0ABS8SJ22_DATST|nr:hypothetical protein [Datura stramonium]